MSHDNKTELLDAIFRVFPKASIVRKSDVKSFQETVKTTNENPELAKRAKARRAVLRACKHKFFDSRQLSLFDETERGGI